MKTLIETTSKISKFIFEDDVEITLTPEQIITPEYTIGDMDSSNSTLIENITDTPQDWIGHKYMYENNKWKRSPSWMDIRDREILELKKRIEVLEK